MNNWNLGCNSWHSKMQGTPSRNNRKGTNDGRHKCTEPCRKSVEEKVTISTIKHNEFCEHINE